MSAKDNSVFVRHMRDATRRIQSYIDGVSKSDYAADFVLQDAVVRQLEILGEAAGRVSRDFAADHLEIPWGDITGMRHRLIHDYFEVDVDLVWTTATKHVPDLQTKIIALLKEMGVSE